MLKSSASLSSHPSPLSYQSKDHGFDSQRMHVWLRSLAGMHCKSLWLKAIAKCINANVFLVTKLFSTQPVFQKWFDIVTHWEEMTETKPLVVVEVSAFIFISLLSCSQFKQYRLLLKFTGMGRKFYGWGSSHFGCCGLYY